MTIMKVQRKYLTGRLFLCRYRCSTVFRWDTFTDDNYDLDKASDLLTRYPIVVDANDGGVVVLGQINCWTGCR